MFEMLEDRLAPATFTPPPPVGAVLPGFATVTLGQTDDGSTGAISLVDPTTAGAFAFPGAINFFGLDFSSVYLNNNGNLTFDGPQSTFTPFGLTADTGIPIIAPFFADVYTFGASGLASYGFGTVQETNAQGVLQNYNAFGATWTNVDYFADTTGSKQNTFQVLLIDRSDTGAGNFDIEFNYKQIQWETGNDSGGSNGLGGSSATVGYSNGSGVTGTFFELPGSGSPGSFLDTNSTTGLIHNELGSTVSGRYVFSARAGTVSAPTQTTPTITWSNPADIPYGMPLDDAQLDASANVPGTFSYSPDLGTVLNAGAGQTLSVTFTPTDTTDYTTATATATINVDKATPTITWSNPADVAFGTAWAKRNLTPARTSPARSVTPQTSAHCSMPGGTNPVRHVHADRHHRLHHGNRDGIDQRQKGHPHGARQRRRRPLHRFLLSGDRDHHRRERHYRWRGLWDAGDHQRRRLHADHHRAGTDRPAHHNPANRRQPRRHAVDPDLLRRADGERRPPCRPPSAAGTYTVVASFAGSADYRHASACTTFVISQVTPTITWNNPADITYGTPLGDAQLDAREMSPARSPTRRPRARRSTPRGPNPLRDVYADRRNRLRKRHGDNDHRRQPGPPDRDSRQSCQDLRRPDRPSPPPSPASSTATARPVPSPWPRRSAPRPRPIAFWAPTRSRWLSAPSPPPTTRSHWSPARSRSRHPGKHERHARARRSARCSRRAKTARRSRPRTIPPVPP